MNKQQALLAGISVFALSACLGANAADVLPNGGSIVSGAGSVTSSNGAMTITQSTDRLLLNWNGFSIGSANSVTFNQPSQSSVAFNRVTGSDPSVIQGRLTSNGSVFLQNPNGVLFTNTAQVNVGGLLATTLSLTTPDFQNGNYVFDGTSSSAVVNQGNITAANGGSVALIAAKITNDGNITANGGNVLLGAGSNVVVDFGGPVKLQVNKGAVDAQIRNGGLVKADGGNVLFTAKGAQDLTASVINNTGIIEARTLASGQKGRIVLLGDKETDKISVGGRLDASAPNGGDGGFIETSAARVEFSNDLVVTTTAPLGKTGEWLIDPTDITISSASCTGTNCLSAAQIQTNLGTTNVTISTDATNTGSEQGDINVNGDIAWSANTLALSAHNNIWITGNLAATNGAKLDLTVGRGIATNSYGPYATYTVSGSLSVEGTNFRIDSKNNGTSSWIALPKYFNNGLLRFGDGSKDSVTTYGTLQQPYYYNADTKRWYKLTYSTYPLNTNVGFGGVAYADGTIAYLSTSTSSSNDSAKEFTLNNLTIDYSAMVHGSGTITTVGVLDTTNIQVKNTYVLPAGQKYVQTTTELKNTGTSSITNARIWVGTQDDFIAVSDQPTKEKGNFVNGAFVAIAADSDQAKVIQITSGVHGVMFYSTASNAETTIGSCCSPDFQSDSLGSGNALTSPRGTPRTATGDGNYSVYSSFGELAPNASRSIVWYYAAGQVAELASIATNVSAAAEVAVAALANTSAPTTVPDLPQVNAVANVSSTVSNIIRAAAAGRAPGLVPTPTAPALPQGTSSLGLQDLGNVGSFNLVSLPETVYQTEVRDSGSNAAASVVTANAGIDTSGFLRVFVVGGGIKLSSETAPSTGTTGTTTNPRDRRR